MIRLSAPWLLAIGVPLVIFVAWRLRRLPVAHAGRRRRLVQAAMLLGTVCAALALAGLEVGSRVDRLAVVFALDRSRSVERPGEPHSEAAMESIREAVEAMRPDDKAGLVVFGAEASTEVLPSPSPSFGRTRASVPRDGTDLAGAIRRALADLPAEHVGRVVVISDGVQTDGDALHAASVAASRGVVVDVLAVERAPRPEVAVERVRVPTTANPGEPVEVRVVTRATHETPVRVRVIRDGATLAEGETRVAAGTDVLVLRDTAAEPGLHRYDVLVEPLDAEADGARENNEGGSFTRVVGGSRVLVLAGEPAHANALAEAIRRGGVDVDLRGPEGVPADLGILASYDLLVLSDLNARALTQAQLRMVASYVRDLGGGLLMLGARDAFGLGGYAYTPVEEVLPATFDLRRRRDRLSLGMIIAIDKSGSMMAEAGPGVTKLDLANEAAARSAMLLSNMDRVGVMHVDTAVTWTLPMTSVRDPQQIAGVIRRAQPGGGGIYVDITMREAYAALSAEQTNLRHFLLFSDGQDSENMNGTRQMVQDAVRQQITTSIVSMGAGPDSPELERLSRMGGGRFYIVEDLTELPRIFTQETIEASRSAIVEEPTPVVAVMPGGATRGIDFGTAPTLAGHALVNARNASTLLLTAGEEDPLLTVWQHGVGRSAVFASDAGSLFARDWLAWSGYVPLFSQLSRDLARAPERRDARVSLSIDGGVGRIRVEAVDLDGRYRNYLDLEGTVAAPGGRRIEVPLTQTGAGRYEGTFDASAPGPYLSTVREGGEGLVGSAGLVRPSGDELRGEGTDHAVLGQIAALTGGVVRTELTGAFTDRPPPAWSYRPLWPVLLSLALSLLLLSVALRRLVLPPDLLSRLLPAPLRRALRVRPPRAAPARDPQATLAALSAARERAGTRKDAARGEGEVADEVKQARRAKAPADDARGPASEASPGETPAAGPAAGEAPPSSLAEQLLARKKKKR